MAFVSVLVPAFFYNDLSQDLAKICSDFFGLETPTNNFELYELVPLKITKNMNLKNREIAMKMPKTGFFKKNNSILHNFSPKTAIKKS